MKTTTIIAAALVWVGVLAITLPVAAQETKPPNMPARNPWLQDSIYPMTHHNPAQTDGVLFAGPSKGAKLTKEQIKTVPTVLTMTPTMRNIGADRVLYGSGINGIVKILATGESFEHISFTPYPGFEAVSKKATPEAIQAMLTEVDKARRANDDAALLAFSKRMDSESRIKLRDRHEWRLQLYRQGRLPLLRLRRGQRAQEHR